MRFDYIFNDEGTPTAEHWVMTLFQEPGTLDYEQTRPDPYHHTAWLKVNSDTHVFYLEISGQHPVAGDYLFIRHAYAPMVWGVETTYTVTDWDEIEGALSDASAQFDF